MPASNKSHKPHDGKSRHVKCNSCSSFQLGLIKLTPTTNDIPRAICCLHNDYKIHIHFLFSQRNFCIKEKSKYQKQWTCTNYQCIKITKS